MTAAVWSGSLPVGIDEQLAEIEVFYAIEGPNNTNQYLVAVEGVQREVFLYLEPATGVVSALAYANPGVEQAIIIVPDDTSPVVVGEDDSLYSSTSFAHTEDGGDLQTMTVTEVSPSLQAIAAVFELLTEGEISAPVSPRLNGPPPPVPNPPGTNPPAPNPGPSATPTEKPKCPWFKVRFFHRTSTYDCSKVCTKTAPTTGGSVWSASNGPIGGDLSVVTPPILEGASKRCEERGCSMCGKVCCEGMCTANSNSNVTRFQISFGRKNCPPE